MSQWRMNCDAGFRGISVRYYKTVVTAAIASKSARLPALSPSLPPSCRIKSNVVFERWRPDTQNTVWRSRTFVTSVSPWNLCPLEDQPRVPPSVLRAIVSRGSTFYANLISPAPGRHGVAPVFAGGRNPPPPSRFHLVSPRSLNTIKMAMEQTIAVLSLPLRSPPRIDSRHSEHHPFTLTFSRSPARLEITVARTNDLINSGPCCRAT